MITNHHANPGALTFNHLKELAETVEKLRGPDFVIETYGSVCVFKLTLEQRREYKTRPVAPAQYPLGSIVVSPATYAQIEANTIEAKQCELARNLWPSAGMVRIISASEGERGLLLSIVHDILKG